MSKFELQKFFEGASCHAYEYFGAHLTDKGTIFRVYAPQAHHIQVIGEFNNWNGQDMHKTDDRGIWEVEIEGACAGQQYKYRVTQSTGTVIDKSDPYAFYSQLRPNTASIIADIDSYVFRDKKWMDQRTRNFDKPMNIYELHMGSWRIPEDKDKKWYTYAEIADELITYVKENGFTHIEIMPLNEHPFDGSWGYQATGYFSVTSRYGTVKDLKTFVNKCHKAGIGLIMDFVPVHFVKDNYALNHFDGSALYEYKKDQDANSEWGTSNFDLWREEVRSFLMSAANYWLEVFHFDGLRFDAISNLIFWQGNKSRGVNEGALHFIKRLNFHIHELHPTVMTIAEDSSDYPGVTKSTLDGGLGFDYKWDLGWMHDTLKYFKLDPVYRQYSHHNLTFSMAYFYNERFILPLSHDEVVHGKHTIIDKLWGTYEQKFAQCRTLYLYMMTHPGKKLNFMGNEIAMFREWDEEKECDWFMLKYPIHDAFHHYFKDLNHLIKDNEAFYKLEYTWDGFQWIDADNNTDNVYTYIRTDGEKQYLIFLNMSPKTYTNFRVGVDKYCFAKEVLNTDQDIYNGSNVCNPKAIRSKKVSQNWRDYSIEINIGAFSGAVFELKPIKTRSSKK